METKKLENSASAKQKISPMIVTGTRIESGIPGASVSIISKEDIENAPTTDLSTLLGQQSGVQMRDLFGGINGVQATVDVRGFGTVGTQNSLILIDGRRLNDIDLAAVDFGKIPLDSIERIEVIKGNAGSVLYGDGAVGGVINIITKPLLQKPGPQQSPIFLMGLTHEGNPVYPLIFLSGMCPREYLSTV